MAQSAIVRAKRLGEEMDGWLKALIAAACITVIAGGGYLASQEYDAKYSKSARTDALIEQNRQTLERLGD